MIFVCTHKTPAYKLDCPNVVIDNNNSSLPITYRHLRGMLQILMGSIPDEVGIFQQRKRLEATTIPEGYDIVVPNNFCVCQIRSQYGSCHHIEDLDLVEKIIDEKEFSDYIRIPMNKECWWHNVFICKKDFFIQYCNFLFTVLNEYYNINGDRDICFLAERIGSYFIWKNIPRDKIYVSKTITYAR